MSYPWAVNACVSSAVIVTGLGVTSIRASGPACTVTDVEPDTDPDVAVIVKVPVGPGVYNADGSMAPPLALQLGEIVTRLSFASYPLAAYCSVWSAGIV